MSACTVFTYSVVGTKRVEGVAPTHKQASLSAEQHLHEITAFILQEKEKNKERDSLICRWGETKEKKGKMTERIEEKLGLFSRD